MSFRVTYHLIFETRSPLNVELTNLDRLASQLSSRHLSVSTYPQLTLPSFRVTDVLSHKQLLHVCWGAELRSSCFVQHKLSQLNRLPSLSLTFLFYPDLF